MDTKFDARQTIRDAWSKFPETVVVIDDLEIGEKLPRFKSLPSNEIRIYIRHSKPQRVHVFKGALHLTVTYKHGNTIDDASSVTDLRYLSVLPSGDHDHHCTDCRQFTISLYISRTNGRLLCRECFKSEDNESSNPAATRTH